MDGPFLQLRVRGRRDEIVSMEQAVLLAWQDDAMLEWEVCGGAGMWLRVLNAGELWQWQRIERDEEILRWSWPQPRLYVRA